VLFRSLASNGLISGTVNTNVSVDTTFNFTVEAIDAENQETPKAFSVNVAVGEPDFFRTVLLLDGDGANGANNNVFRDSSNNNLTITKFGNTTQGSFTPYSPAGFSGYFDGSSALDVGNSAGFQWGTSDFTMECWVLWNQTPGDGDHIAGTNTSGGGLFWNSSTSIQWNIYGVSAAANYTNPPWASLIGNWNHLAYSRQSGVGRLYLNGAMVATASDTTNYTASSTFIIGSNPSNGQFLNRAYISNLRVIKGQALYTNTSGTFTPSIVALTNSTVGSSGTGVAGSLTGTCSLLALQSNRYIDNSGNNLTVSIRYGSPNVINFSPFVPLALYSPTTHGGSSYFDANGDYLSIPGGTQFNFGSSDLTIEGWVYTLDTNTRKYISGPGNNTADHFDGIGFEIWDNRLCMWASSNGTDWNMLECDTSGNRGNILIPAFSWTHVAMTRSGNTWRSFVNGKVDRTFTASGTVAYNASIPYNIGRTGYDNGSFYFKGYIADYKITTGTALYTGDFTVSSTPLTRGVNTTVLCNFINANIYDWTTRNVIETMGNAKVNTAITKYGTGSLEFDGTGDVLDITYSSIWDRFLLGNFTIEGWFYARTLTSYNGMLTHWRSNGTIGWTLETVGTGVFLYIWDTSISNYGLAGGGTFTTNQWNHVACVRNGATITVYLNGTAVGSTLSMTGRTTTESTDPLVIGGMWSNTGPSGGLDSEADWDGFIDDLRVTKGLARYTANFTPPTSAYRRR